MDNLSTHSKHADQPREQQANGLPLPVPPSQVLDNHMIEQQHANLSPFGFSPEQHGLQLDQVVQLYNEQVWVSQQREMAYQRATLLSILTADALIQKEQEIARLRAELQRKNDACDQLRAVTVAYEMNHSHMRMVPPVQQETHSHVASNELDAPGSGDEVTSKARTAAETTKTSLVCNVCNSGLACMVFLPCKHFFACKPCGAGLTGCPICGAMKSGAVDLSLAEN